MTHLAGTVTPPFRTLNVHVHSWGVILVQRGGMAGAATGMSLFRSPTASAFCSRLPSSLHSSLQDPSPCRAELGPMPSSPLLLLSVCSFSPTCSPLLNSENRKVVGLTAGSKGGKFVQDLRRPAKRGIPRTAGSNVRSMAGQSAGVIEETIKRTNSKKAVVVYSKSWCPYCSMVKALFTKLGASFELVELDQLADEQEIQDGLRALTGQSTVPNVFIGGKHIGGCDDTMALHQRGELIPALEAAGLKITPA